MERKHEVTVGASGNSSLMFQAMAKIKLKTATTLIQLAWKKTFRGHTMRYQKIG